MSKPNGLQIATRMFNTPLMIDAQKASVIAQAYGPRVLGAGQIDISGVGEAQADRRDMEPSAGSLLGDGTYRRVKRSGGYLNYMGIAVVTVTGTLVRRGAFVGENSGMTSYEGLSAQIRAAVEDDEVRAIAFEIDSFGGEADGMFALAEEIRAAREHKPIYAFLSDYALSAGYAIASQADYITVPPFGKAGSIGVVTMHADHEKQLEQEGVKITMIHSGDHKVEGNPFEALPENVRDRIQSESDQMWTAFAQMVEAGRRGKVTMQDALKMQAGVFRGQEAVDAKLVDEVSEAKSAFSRLVEELNPPIYASGGVVRSAAQSTLTGVHSVTNAHCHPIVRTVAMPADDLSKTTPQVAAAVAEIIRGSGCATGADAPKPKETVMSKDQIKPDAGKQKATTSDDDQVVATTATNDDAAKAAGAAERNRAGKITDKVAQAGLPASFAAKLIADGTSVENAYGKILDEKAAKAVDGGDINSTSPSATIVSDGVDRTSAGLTKALLARANMPGGEQNEFTGMTLREMARVSLSARGIDAPRGGVMALASAAFAPAAASNGMHSTSDFGNILSDVAHKSMARGFDETEETFEKFTSVGNLTDFKPTRRVGLDAFPSLIKVREGAEFKYGSMGDYGETAMLATYGRLFAITRQTIINDDLDAFTKIPMKMGRAARRTVGDLVFAVLSSNPAMSDDTALFHADHKNLATSSGAPSELAINAAITAMASQTSGKEKTKLNIPVKYLLAPPSLRATVLQSLNSEYAPDNTAKTGTTKQPNAFNTVRDAAEPIFDARITGSKWFMAADPAQFDTIEVSYLDGISTPWLDQQDGWTVDGTEFKVRIDAAATALAAQGLYKNAG